MKNLGNLLLIFALLPLVVVVAADEEVRERSDPIMLASAFAAATRIDPYDLNWAETFDLRNGRYRSWDTNQIYSFEQLMEIDAGIVPFPLREAHRSLFWGGVISCS